MGYNLENMKIVIQGQNESGSAFSSLDTSFQSVESVTAALTDNFVSLENQLKTVAADAQVTAESMASIGGGAMGGAASSARASASESETARISGGWNRVQTSLEKVNTSFGKMTSGATNAMMDIAGGNYLFELADKAVEAGNGVYELSKKLHVTGAEASQLNRIITLSGGSTQAFTATITRLDKSLETAGSKGNATTKALAEFGVTLTDTNGKLLPVNDQLAALAAAYEKATEAGNDEAFTASVLGTRGVQLVGVLADYKDAAEAASQVKGIGINPEDAHKAAVSMAELKMQLSQAGMIASNAAMPIIKEILPSLMGGLQFISTHSKEIVPIVMGVAGAIVAVKVATFAMNTADQASVLIKRALVLITNTETVATEAATVAQEGLNVAMDSNPIGLVIAGVGALIGIMTAFASTQQKATQAADEFAAQLERDISDIDQQNAKVNASAETEQMLSDKLYQLAGVQNKSNSEMAQMRTIVSQLNSMIPNLNLSLNEQTGALNQQQTAIEGIIRAQRQQLLQEQNNQNWLTLYNDRATAANNLQAANEKLSDATQRYNYNVRNGIMDAHNSEIAMRSANDEYDKAKKAADAANTAYYKLVASEQELSEATADSSAAIQQSTDDLGEYYRGLNEAQDAAQDWLTSEESNMQKLSALQRQHIMTELQGLGQLSDAKKAALDKEISDQVAANTQLEQLTETHLNQMGNYSDKHIKQEVKHLDTFLKDLNTRNKEFQNWEDNIHALAGKLPEDVIAELKKMGPGYSGVVADLVADTKKGSKGAAKLDEFSKSMQQRMNEAATAAAGDMGYGSLPTSIQGVTTNAVNDAAAGLTNSMPDVTAAASKVAGAISTAMTIDLTAKGANAVSSFAQAIRDNTYKVVSAITDMANKVPDTIDVVLKIHSPSRVTGERGKNTVLGYVNEVLANLGLVRDAANQFASAAVPDIAGVGGMALAGASAGYGYATPIMASPIMAAVGGGGGAEVHYHLDVHDNVTKSEEELANRILSRIMRQAGMGGKINY